MSTVRWKDEPDEHDYPAAASYLALLTDPATAQTIVERLSAEILKAMDAPDFREKLHGMGSEPPAIRTPEQFSAFVANELRVYSELVKRSGAKAD